MQEQSNGPAYSYIMSQLRERAGDTGPAELQYYVSIACHNLLKDRNLPGSTYPEQIIAESLRLLAEDEPLTTGDRLTLLEAIRGRSADGSHFIQCPSCRELLLYSAPSKLADGPIATAILQRLLYKHWREKHNGA